MSDFNAEQQKMAAAVTTLEFMRYTWTGGIHWRPPIGKKPDFDLMDSLQAEVDRLKTRVENLEKDHSNALDEIDRLKLTALPIELTPLVKSVLGMMCFKTGPYAHIYQAAGFDIPKKTEEEQAFVLHRWLLLALQHGNDWPLIAQKEVEELRAQGKLWAVNIPLEPDSGNVLHAALDKAHAEQIVKRLHSEIDVAYPNVGNAMKYYITVDQWLGTSAEHTASLSKKWWEQTSFKAQEID